MSLTSMNLKSGLRQGFLGAVALLMSLAGIANAELLTETPSQQVDFLRSVPLEVSGYPAAQCLSSRLTSADQILQVLNSTPVFLVHMEALRRGYAELPLTEQTRLLKALRARHTAKENDLAIGFDLGYAELVYENNKTGLFFLRKANDKFQNQFTNLAYGMAQVEADITLENAKPEEMTTRKMDAMYRLGDAVKIDAGQHQPGFWPSYMRVIEKMKPMVAYKSFSRRDFSVAYLPFGNPVVPLSNVTVSSLSEVQPGTPGTTITGIVNNSCSPNAEAGNTDAANFFGKNMLSQRTAVFRDSKATIQFYPTSEDHLYNVRVLGPTGNPMLSFQSHVMGNIVEDLDGDGTFEIVARQFQYNPFKPFVVYRYTAACGFELDQKVRDSFQ
jgi:hypothetical protein